MGLFIPSVFPHYRQLDAMDCGPSCLKIIAKHYGRSFSTSFLREKCHLTREGVSFRGISDAAEDIGFRTLSVKIDIVKLRKDIPLPCIAHWNNNHFVVIYKITKNNVYISDPAYGKIKYLIKEFENGWHAQDTKKGLILCLEPTPNFFSNEGEEIESKISFKFLFKYMRGYNKFIVQLCLGMFFTSFIGLVVPFLTQSLVDFGINNQEIGFVYTILIAQLMLFFGKTSIDIIRGWILLHMGTRVNIAILTDFLMKLMKLPMSYFDKQKMGDLMQRIQDHKRIETFLTSSTIQVAFSLINLIIYGVVLAIYSTKIITVFFVGTFLHTLWLIIFLKKRRELDFKGFSQHSENQSSLYEIIGGMQELKLFNAEKQKRWGWERIQVKLFKINISQLALNQLQSTGGSFISEVKNILITFIAAIEVINGNMTLGMMMAISYITGQLSNPISQLLSFIQITQDAKISLERLNEIHGKKDEDDKTENKMTFMLEKDDIKLDDISFQYEGPNSELVLQKINFSIPKNKITAIVGHSGSGKTTLLKLLLKYYKPTQGTIKIGDVSLENVNSEYWRKQCGSVMQDGHLFNDSISNNIALGDDIVDHIKLAKAVDVANIRQFIESLPLSYNTKIGNDGHGLSQGQRQRIQIARAVYKNPEYLFFDEATSFLDANNESAIMKNLSDFYLGKTVVVVAHRLSTVINADQIIVLKQGKVREIGTHKELLSAKGDYFELIKNQLELTK